MFENMQNHNYADWELTQLLPEINPYPIIDEWVEIENEDGIFYILESQIEDEDCCGSTIKDAWSWEDIRLYLLDKGFVISIHYWGSEHLTKYCSKTLYTICIMKNGLSFIEDYKDSFNTYEEARKEAIIYCLNLINNDKKR